jgi:asparagine synthase (glutamine-hydrolysing)
MPSLFQPLADIHFKHPEWTCLEADGARIWTRGWIDQGGVMLDATAMGRELAAFVVPPAKASLSALAARIQGWIGNFAFCLARDDEVFLGVDAVRTLPLLHAQVSGGLLVSDSYEWLLEKAGRLELNEEGAEEYLTSGFVYGSATLHRGISSLQAGEILRLDRTASAALRYFAFNPDAFQNPDLRLDARTFRTLDDLLLNSVRRMLGSARNVKRWVVPLSGGYDSRIVAAGLRRLGADNVLCLSYGRVGNEESALSQRVADALGYEWHFAEYNRVNWAKIMADPQTQAYVRYACNGNSLPVLQDYPALAHLRESGVLREGDVIVPGHTLDFLSGSHLDAVAVESRETSIRKASAWVVERHCAFWWDEQGQEAVRRRVQRLVERESEDVRGRSAAAIIEWFDWQERQAKFIVNNVRAYEFLGFRWRLPLWDQALVAWWRSVPYAHRLNRRLLCEAFDQALAIPEVRKIPIYGKRPRSSGPLAAQPRRYSPFTAARKRVFNTPSGVLIRRIFRRFMPPVAKSAPMAFEEYFAGQADSVGKLLGLGGGVDWPEPLRRHFRWRENWKTEQANSNALFAAYVTKQYLSGPWTDRGIERTSFAMKPQDTTSGEGRMGAGVQVAAEVGQRSSFLLRIAYRLLLLLCAKESRPWYRQMSRESALSYFFMQRVIRINAHVPWPVHWSSIVTQPERIHAKDSRACPGYNPGQYIQSINGILLGRNVWLGPGVKLISANHDVNDYAKHVPARSIAIGDHVWLGADVKVLPGVEIGSHVVVGAASVVTKDLPSNCVAVGIPAVPVRQLGEYTGEFPGKEQV